MSQDKSAAESQLSALNNIKVAQLKLPKVTEKPILVTGAGGWIASHTVYQLLDKGYSVRGTVRNINGPKYQFLKDLHPAAKDRLTLVEADLLKPEGWDEAVKGVEYVLHLASPFTFSAREEDLVKPAVQGVENVYAAVLRNSKEVKRIVHTSSIVSVVMGHPNDRYGPLVEKRCSSCDEPSLKKRLSSKFSRSSSQHKTKLTKTDSDNPVETKTETPTNIKTESSESKVFSEDDWSVVNMIGGYEKSKTLAEQKAWEIINSHNESAAKGKPEEHIDLVVINPAFVFGPLLAAVHTEGESSVQIKRLMDRVYPFLPDLESEHVDVRDVANAHIRGMELPAKDVSGKRFLLAADNGRLRLSDEGQVLKDQFGVFGYNPPTATAPSFLFTVGQYFMSDCKAAVDKIGKGSPVTTKNAREILKMTDWISAENALNCHALTMIKYGGVQKKDAMPEKILENFKAY